MAVIGEPSRAARASRAELSRDPQTPGAGPAAPPSAPRVLIVEDNEHYAVLLRNQLEIEGFTVAIALDSWPALQTIRLDTPTLVVLDIMLPSRDGYDVLRQIRGEGRDVPVLILTARRDEEDKLRGFGLGADDFIVKPVTIRELVARIRAVLRRVRPGASSVETTIRFGDIEVIPATRTVKRSGREVDLRPKEYDLLLALLRERGRTVSRIELLRDVWGYHADTVSRTVDTHLAGLRQKLEADSMNPQHIITVRSVGYLLRRSEAGQ